jgi:hypothetical protein
MINTLVNNINAGFGNCIFINKDEDSVRNTILRGMDNSKGFFNRIPKKIDLVNIDDMHDRLVMDFSDNGTDVIAGMVTCRMASDGRFYVFKSFDDIEQFN